MLDIVLDSLIDSIKLVPFLFIAYLIMECVEHKTGDKTKNIIKKSGKFGPFFGGILGIFPQCGFSAVASNLYAGRIITLGTLIAIFLSTSDEMLPILISENVEISIILQILVIKLVIGIIAGFLIDFVGQAFFKEKNTHNPKHKENKNEIHSHEKEKIQVEEKVSNNKLGKEIEEEIGHVCEHEHCNCKEDGIVISALKHTVSIFTFIMIFSIIINTVIYFIGEENISNIVLNTKVLGPIISGVIGFIPNCASSVILTQLYLENVISIGSMIAGLLVGSGIGILILFRVNKNIRQNFKIVGLLYVIGVVCGILIDFII